MLNKLVVDSEDFIGALKELPKNLLTMFVYAYQSYLFNKKLSRRIQKKLTLNAAVVGDIISDEELERLSEHREVLVLHGRLNCAGNLILANDEKAWVHPRIGEDLRADIAEVMDVEVGEGDIAGMGVVGSVGCATNKGVLVHPKARKEELDTLREFFGIHVDIGTLNYGSPMIGACCVANSRGAVTGTASTGIELGRLEEALDLF